MKWKNIKYVKPNHKDLVLVWNGEITLPAIYYNNQSFIGFYAFTTYYHICACEVYGKTRLKSKHKITGVVKWRLIDKP